MLTKQEAYVAAFYYLDRIYDKEPDENLGDLLSSMNPFLFKDSQSADPAVWFDWLKCVESIIPGDDISEVEAFQAMMCFLQYNQQELGYNLENLLEKLSHDGDNSEWIECVNEAQK